MDPKAFFKFTYGLFVVGVEYEGRLNGCIINTAAQATAEPGRILATMMKTNLTTEMIAKKKSLAISILGLDCPLEKIAHFGMSSGRTGEKFAAVAYEKDALGNPYILDGAVARFSCQVEQMIDLDSHYLFICRAADGQVTDRQDPITYADYRVLKSGGTLNKAAAPGQPAAGGKGSEKWVCSICHYVYDGAEAFDSLQADWICPVCGRGKSVFVREG